MMILARAFLAGALLLSSSAGWCKAATIEVDRESLVETEKSRTARATLSVADLFETPTLTFTGFDDDDASEIVYTKTTATRTTVEDNTETVEWHGSLTVGGLIGFATLVLQASGNVAASFSTDTSTFFVGLMSDGTYSVQETYWKDAQESADAGEPGNCVNCPTVDLPLEGAETAPDEVDYSTSTGEGTKLTGPNRMLREQQEERRRLGLSTPTMDLLVIVTNRAYCENAGRTIGCAFTTTTKDAIDGKIAVGVSQTNNGMETVGISARVRLVETKYLAAGFDGLPTEDTLDVIRTDSDINQWRDESQADLVAMITGRHPEYAGIAYLNSHESVTSWTSFPNFTFGKYIFKDYEFQYSLSLTTEFCSHIQAMSCHITWDAGTTVRILKTDTRMATAYKCREVFAL